MSKAKKRKVSLVRSSYQPSKAELEKPVEFPDDLTPDELAEAVVQPVEIDWKDRTE
ncbi:MAG: hypothetical protein OXF79_28875 [Chloroflexi bacterium]|nr:hypothetical protein [Chloroflexota bacterium]